MTYPVRIDGGTLTNVSEFIITGLSIEFIKYEVIFSTLTSDSASEVGLRFRTSADNGVTWASNGGDYTYRTQRSSGSSGNTAHVATSSLAYAEAVSGLQNTAGNFLAGVMEIFNPMHAGSRTTITTFSGGIIQTGTTCVQEITGQRMASEANNAIRIYPAGGTFSMQYVIHGYGFNS